MSSVDLAGLLLPRHLRRCGLAAGGKIAVCDRRVQSKYSVLQSAGVRDPTLAYWDPIGSAVFEIELIGPLSTEGDANVSWVRYDLLTNTIV
jgi:hypothetical protein